MNPSEMAERVERLRNVDQGEFEARVREEADRLKEQIGEGEFDNEQALVGMEYEAYCVDATGALVHAPDRLFSLVGFEREVGRHQAEFHTNPQPLNRYAIDAQEAELKARLDSALTEGLTGGVRLVSDGMWTIPPEGQTAGEYITASVEEEGVELAENMSHKVRYYAQDNAEYTPQTWIDAPNVSLGGDTVLLNGLTTSIQPHYQVPTAADLPAHFRSALRIAGPLLALGVNSPFFPPDLYGDADADEVLSDGWSENRIIVFEGVLNAEDDADKVQFPRDVESVGATVDRIAADPVVIPMLFDTGDGFGEEYAHFHHKHASYWRWIRPVFDGSTAAAANARIEFRPLPSQPTVRDSVAFLAAFAGLLEGMRVEDHPARSLDWTTARENFYAAARDGLGADLRWIDADGDPTSDIDALYADLLAVARTGLERCGVPSERAERFLTPLRARVDGRTTPAGWKREAVRHRLAEGDTFEAAIHGAQTAYIRRQADTLIEGEFTEWPDPGGTQQALPG